MGLYLLQEAAGRHGSRILTGRRRRRAGFEGAAAAEEPRRREQTARRRRLLSLTLGEPRRTQRRHKRAARAPAPTRRRSSRTAQRPSLWPGARARPSPQSPGRRPAETSGARADSHSQSPTRKRPGAEHRGEDEARPQRPLLGWRSGSGARAASTLPTASGLGPKGSGLGGQGRTARDFGLNPGQTGLSKSLFFFVREATAAIRETLKINLLPCCKWHPPHTRKEMGAGEVSKPLGNFSRRPVLERDHAGVLAIIL